MIEMTIESVRINLATQQRVVILKSVADERQLFIWIAQPEAYAIAVKLQATDSLRPLTHDLLAAAIQQLGGRVERVIISSLVDEIFYSQIIVQVADQQVELDARPSDAMALAVRVQAPVFASESVLEQAGIILNEQQSEKTEVPPLPTETPMPSTAETTITITRERMEEAKTSVERANELIVLLQVENRKLRDQIEVLEKELESARQQRQSTSE